MSAAVASQLSTHLQTELTMGRIDMGLLNRIILEDVLLKDQAGAELLKVARLSARFDIWELFKGKISINSVQLFGFDLKLSRPSAQEPLNLQFILEALATDQPQTDSKINLRINSLLVRRGKLSYDVLDQAQAEEGVLDSQHLQFNNIIANISLKALQNDSIHANIKRLSLNEQSGLKLKKLALKVVGNREQMQIDQVKLALPNSLLALDTIKLNYKGITSFEDFAEQVELSIQTLPSYLTLADLSPLVPSFKSFHEKIQLGLAVEGTLNHLNCPRISLQGGEHLVLQGSGTVEDLSRPRDAFIDAKLSRLSLDQEGMRFLLRNLQEDFEEVPPILQRMGHLSFRGELSGYPDDFVTYGVFRSKQGSLRTDIKFTNAQEKHKISYRGSLQATDFKLGELLANEDLNTISFNFEVNGSKQKELDYPDVLLQGEIADFDYSNYRYEKIAINGRYKQGGFDGALLLDDPHAYIDLNGRFNLVQALPTFDFTAQIKHFKPYLLHLNDRDEEEEFSVELVANFTGGSIDEMNGEININALDYRTSDLSYQLDNFNVQALHTAQENKLLINSNFLKAHIEGNYSYKTLWNSILNTTKRYLPSLTASLQTPAQSHNNFSFEVDLVDTKILTHLFNIPFQTYTHSTLKGYFDDENQRVHIEGYFPRLRYNNDFYESAMLLLENPGEHLEAHARFTKQRKYGAVNVAVLAQAKDDYVTTSVNWGNNGTVTYSGRFDTETYFERLEDERKQKYLQTHLSIHPSEVILNDSVWQLHASEVLLNNKKVEVENFLFSKGNQFININGMASAQAQDTIFLYLNDVDLGYIFDITGISEDVDFKGKTTGYAVASQLFKEPQMTTNLHVTNFTFNDGPLGDMDIYGAWDNESEGIFLDADMNENDVGLTAVTGFIYPLAPKSGLDLKIAGRGTNIKFLEFYMDGIASDIRGRAYGDARLHGKFSGLNLEGNLLADASLQIDVLNTSFALQDTLRFSPTGIDFRQIQVKDPEGHLGTLNGRLNYRHFGDLSYRFEVASKNLLVMNTQEDPDWPFYGKIFGTGNTIISGNANELNVDAAIRTERNSQFTFITNATESAASNQFVEFVDKTPFRTVQDTVPLSLEDYMAAHRERAKIDEELDIRLNLQIDASPSTNVKVILDPLAGDYMSVWGTGNVRLDFYNKGDIKLFGSYEINKGLYKFSLQEVIRKDFTILEGSSITFNGRPLDASLNIHAQHTVNTVSLNDLIPSESLLTNQPHIKVNCMMNISGVLTRPQLSFDLDIPNERDEIKTLVRNYVSTEEQKNMQVLYLLGIGKFYMADNTNTQSSDMMSSVLSSTLSGQLNDILSHMINNNNWTFGTNVSTGNKGWTDVEVEGMLSAQLLNNRLLINGNFGYRDNPLTNTNFVGDFEAELLLNRSGNIRLRAYSKTNDRYLSRTNLTTQGIGILFRRDFTYWKELLFWRNIRARRQAKQAQKAASEATAQEQEHSSAEAPTH